MEGLFFVPILVYAETLQFLLILSYLGFIELLGIRAPADNQIAVLCHRLKGTAAPSRRQQNRFVFAPGVSVFQLSARVERLFKKSRHTAAAL